MNEKIEPDYQIVCNDCNEDASYFSHTGKTPEHCPICGEEAQIYELD
jgi:rubrerythrin